MALPPSAGLQVVGDRYGWEDRDSGGKDAYL